MKVVESSSVNRTTKVEVPLELLYETLEIHDMSWTFDDISKALVEGHRFPGEYRNWLIELMRCLKDRRKTAQGDGDRLLIDTTQRLEKHAEITLEKIGE